jgi:hypothetical protein
VTVDRARSVADAVLFEGYSLYPYRRSSLKNQRRSAMFALMPGGAPPSFLESVCLLRGDASTSVTVHARFLQPVRSPAADGVGAADVREVAARLGLDAGVAATSVAFHWPGDAVAGGVRGVVRARVEPRAPQLFRVTVRLENLSGPVAPGHDPVDAALLSAHLLLAAEGGSFVSLLDPPPDLRGETDLCVNVGVFPVLAGDAGRSDVVLSSPIILGDFPETAPESPVALFDGTEIDEMLALRILTLTDAERREATASDRRLQDAFARIEGLGPEGLARLHGTARGALDRG